MLSPGKNFPVVGKELAITHILEPVNPLLKGNFSIQACSHGRVKLPSQDRNPNPNGVVEQKEGVTLLVTFAWCR